VLAHAVVNFPSAFISHSHRLRPVVAFAVRTFAGKDVATESLALINALFDDPIAVHELRDVLETNGRINDLFGFFAVHKPDQPADRLHRAHAAVIMFTMLGV
jgi:hypothetical protein